MQCIQLRNRIAQNLAILCRQDTGYGHAVLPTVRRGGIGILCVGHTHPTKLNAAGAVQEGLGRVEVKALVQRLELTQRTISAEIPIQREITAGVNILEAVVGLCNALRRYTQEPLTIDLKQIGTLPHITEHFGRGDGVAVRPVHLILRLENQHFTAIFQRARTLHHIILAVHLPYLGITDMAGQTGRIVLVLHQALLGRHGLAILRDRQTGIVSATGADVIMVTLVLDVAGVIQVHLTVLDVSRTRVDTVDVIGLIGTEQDGQVLPVHQITALAMTPVLDTARAIERAVLEEDMVVFSVLAQAVRIVEPAGRRLNVEGQSVRVLSGLGAVLPLDACRHTQQVAL